MYETFFIFSFVSRKKSILTPSFLSASEKSSVTSSIILKFGPGVKPDPTKPFQNHLRRNLGRLPGPVNLKTLIQSVRIVHPGKFLHKYVKVNENIPWF